MQFARGAAVLLLVFLTISLTTISFPSSDSVHGVVTSGDAPVAGATVRWQGVATHAQTDHRGRFTLAGPRRQRLITAAKPGFLIAAGSQPPLRLLPVRCTDMTPPFVTGYDPRF